MPFCVVLTKEGGEIMVTLVPESWVKEEILYWPKTETTSELEQFRRNPESLPGEDWEKSKCKIKVSGIATFSEGLKLEALYSSLEDTEDEERYYKARLNKRKHPIFNSITKELLDLNQEFNIQETNDNIDSTTNNDNASNNKQKQPILNSVTEEHFVPNTDFNMEETNNTTDNVKAGTLDNESEVHMYRLDEHESENIVNAKEDAVQQNNDENLITLNFSQLTDLITENSSLSTENKILKESIKRFENLEQTTRRGFSIIQVQVDKLFDLLRKHTSLESEIIGNTTPKPDEEIAHEIIEFPIKSKEHLDLLEESLNDGKFKNAMVKKFSSICGTSGTQTISRIGLLVMKAMFTDELLCQFTWKGIKGCTKLPFMNYIKIRELFFKIVKLAVSYCSAIECDSFLQNSAIKHSGQRLKRKSREVTQYEEKKRKAEPTAQVNEESLSLNNNNTSDDENEEKETNKTQIMEKQSAIRETNKPIKYKNNNAGKEADDTSYSIKRSKVIAVQSDVKINNTKKYLNNTSDDKKEHKENKTKIMEKQSVVRETNQPIKHKNNAGKEADDTLCTSYSIRRSNVITVLSDVKINNKIKDLENDTKATNISSSDLTNSYVLKKNA